MEEGELEFLVQAITEVIAECTDIGLLDLVFKLLIQ